MDDFIPTRVSQIRKDAAEGFVAVNYEKPKKKKKTDVPESEKNNKIKRSKSGTTENDQNEDIDDRKKQELEMKRVRFEVMKFGMSGFKGAKAEEAETSLAISLGAIPPKRKGVNYKLLKLERKEKKEAEQNDLKNVSGLEKSLMKHKSSKTRKKKPGGLLGVYGKVDKKIVGKIKK